MRRCSDCGRDNAADARFCADCGHRLTEAFGGGRYVLERPLGEGALKRVHLARDTQSGALVALSEFKAEALDEGARERVRREAEALARLGDHPHVVAVLDHGEQDGRPYLVSPHLAGGDLAQRLAAGPLPVEEAMRIAGQLCDALAHAHAHGVVHRDLKPANVWLDAGGDVALGDFGLAVLADRSRITVDGAMTGTALYMPPEQAVGRTAGARSDLYALGVVLYEMVTGRPPFAGDDVVSVVSQHVNTAPARPSLHAPGLPAALEELILALLAKDPDERPPSAAEVRDHLRGITSGAPQAAPTGAGALVRQGRAPFVGRDEELRRLKAQIDRGAAGHGALVLLAGEPGIGKTRLTEEAAVYARLRGTEVLVGHCYESEGTPAYWPWIEIVRAFLGARDRGTLAETIPPQAVHVAQIVPELRERLPELPEPPVLLPDQERQRLFEGFAALLEAGATQCPLLLVLDDLHWADRPSLLLLEHVARRLRDSRLIVVGTYRDVELDRRHPLAGVLAGLRRERLYERLLLRGLSGDEVRAMLEAAAQHELDAAGLALAAALQRETEGNPFFIEETIRHLVESGRIFRREGRWVSDAADIDELGIPEGVREVIGRRLSRLSEACDRALQHAAVLGREFEFAVLAAMTDAGEDALLDALDEALEAQLVTEVGGGRSVRYSFSHALVREALYEELSLPRRQRLHRRAAEAIEQVHARDVDRHVAAIAVHLRTAGAAADPNRALDYSMRAGEAAAGMLAWEEAAAHWDAALEVAEDEGLVERRLELLQRVADTMYLTGLDLAKGISCLEDALSIHERQGDHARAAQTHGRLGIHLSTYPATMDIPRALAHFRAAERILAAEPESTALGVIYAGLASAASYGMNTEEGLRGAARAMEIGGRGGREGLWANATALYGYLRFCMGHLAEGRALMERAWETADRLNEPFAAFVAAWLRCASSSFVLDPREGIAWGRRERDRPRLAQAPIQRAILAAAELWCALLLGAPEESERLLPEASLETFPAVPALIALQRGDLAKAERLLAARIAIDGERGNLFLVQGAYFWLGRLRRVAGDPAGAVAAYRACLDVTESAGWKALDHGTLSEYAIALVEAGRLDDAGETLERVREIRGADEDHRGGSGRFALAEAVLAAAGGTPAPDRFDEADRIFAELALRWDRADALTVRARAELALGEHEAAVAHADAAVALLRELRAGTVWVERALAVRLQAQGVDPAALQTSIDAVAASVERERPGLVAGGDGGVTILFSDIEGSTVLNEQLGDAAWFEVLRRHNAIVREQVAAHGGQEVKCQGDGFMLAFPSPGGALACAVAIQRALEGEAADGVPLRVRIGLHAGEVIRDADDFFGRNVVVAARIADAARGGEILVSSALRDRLGAGAARDLDGGRLLSLKGLSEPQPVHAVAWRAAGVS